MLQIVVIGNTLKSLLDCKEIKPVNPKGNQSWVFIGRTDAEAPILWPPDVKNWLIGKNPDAGKDWRQAKKGRTEDEMVGRLHWLDGHEFEQAPGDGEGQGSLVCSSLGGQKESDTTELLHFPFSLSCNGEGNGNPPQCSCLENPRDGGARWAAIYGVAQSQTQLKRLSSSLPFVLLQVVWRLMHSSWFQPI